MKPLKIIIPIASILTLLPFLYVLFVPSSLSVAFIYSHVWFDSEWKGVTLELQDKQIAYIVPQDGEKLKGFGYSMVVQGYKDIKILSTNEEAIFYTLADKKMIMMDKKSDAKFLYALASNIKMKQEVESTTGLTLDNEYASYLAMLKATPQCFSVFDNQRNRAVAILLVMKEVANPFSAYYQFDTGKIKGIEKIESNDGTSCVLVEVFDVNDLNSLYQVSFINLTEQEVDAVIATIQFDTQK